MIAGINNSLSALNAFKQSMNVTAGNIANINTDGYTARRTEMTNNPDGTVAARVDAPESSPTPSVPPAPSDADLAPSAPPPPSNVSLEREIPSMMAAQRGYEANLNQIDAYDKNMGFLLDLTG